MLKHSKLLFWFLISGIIPVSSQTYEKEFNSRAQKIINYVADDYKWDASGWYNCNPSDYGKYNWPIVVASFHKYGVTNPKGNQYIPHFNTIACIQNRFHFNLMGETYIFTHYWNAPSVKANIKDYLTAAWKRTDSYNLFTSEGTENHNAMTRPAAYLYAQIARDSFPSDFPDATQKLAELKHWIKDWAKMLYSSGPGEWNSSTYAPYSISGWLALYDGAKDPDVRLIAKAVLDYYATELALHYTQGITGGYESRNGNGYESVVTSGDYLAWLWFGESPRKISFSVGTQNVEAATSIYAAASTYRPPKAIIQLATKKDIQNAMFYNSKGEYLMNNPSYIKQTFYVGKTFTLGAAYLPYGGFTGGDVQIQAWKFVGKVAPDTTVTNKTANVIVGYGSKEWNKARGRMPWDQLVHHRNVLIQTTKVPTNFNTIKSEIQTIINNWKTAWDADFAQRFPSDSKPNPVNMSPDVLDANFSYMAVWRKNASVGFELNNNIAFFTLDSNYVAIRSIAQTAPTVSTATDNYGIKDAAGKGELCGLILEAGSKQDYISLQAFKNAINSTTVLDKSQINTARISYKNLDGEIITMQYNSNGTFTEPIYDWGYGPTKPQMAQKTPPFVQPVWPTGESHGRIASWSVNQTTLNLNNNWPIFSGPHVILNNSVLRLYPNSIDSLHIDFTGDLPVYTSNTTTQNPIFSATTDDLKLYPNPATEIVNVVFSSPHRGNISIELIDLSGQSVYLIYSKKTDERQVYTIPLSKKFKGLYLVKVVAGKHIISQKVQVY